MHPLIHFNFGGISVTLISYELFTVLAAVTGGITAYFTLRRRGIKPLHSLVFLLCMAMLFLVGARLWNYAVLPEAYGGRFKVYTLRLSGFSLYGGITGSFLALLVTARIIGYNTYSVLDAFVLPSGIAFIIARAGCFLNGCCSGKVTQSFLGVHFPGKPGVGAIFGKSIPFIGSVKLAVYPTQLFEMALALVGLVPAIMLSRVKKLPSGVSFLFYGIWACVMRWIVLYFRELPYPPVVVNLVYPGVYGGLTILLGILLISRCRNHWRHILYNSSK